MSYYQIGMWFAESIGDVRATVRYRNTLEYDDYHEFQNGFYEWCWR